MIARANTLEGPRYVEIGYTDGAFEQQGCAPFVKVNPDDLLTTWPRYALDTFGAGDYLLWRDIAASTWWVPGPTSGHCHWKRLRGFSGTDADIIEEGTTPAVAMSIFDVGFSSDGCGTWEYALVW